MSRERRRTRPRMRSVLAAAMLEIGYCCGMAMGYPIPSPRRPGGPPEPFGPPGWHPERACGDAPTDVERLLWDDLGLR